MARSPQVQIATLASVPTSTTSATLFAANGKATGRSVWNDSAAILYLAYGGTAASATNATVPVAANGYYEVPPNFFGGVVTGILATGTGNARVTEW